MNQPEKQGETMPGDSDIVVCVCLSVELADGHKLEFDFSQVRRFHFHRIVCPFNRIAIFGPDGEHIGRSVFPSWSKKLRFSRAKGSAANEPAGDDTRGE
jgi:hypothetical protein